MRILTSLVLCALFGAIGCGGDGGTADMAQGMPICPANVDSSQAACTATDTHCYTLGGVYPYGANCIGCDPNHRHWETDDVALICDAGTRD